MAEHPVNAPRVLPEAANAAMKTGKEAGETDMADYQTIKVDVSEGILTLTLNRFYIILFGLLVFWGLLMVLKVSIRTSHFKNTAIPLIESCSKMRR